MKALTKRKMEYFQIFLTLRRLTDPDWLTFLHMTTSEHIDYFLVIISNDKFNNNFQYFYFTVEYLTAPLLKKKLYLQVLVHTSRDSEPSQYYWI